MIHVWRIIKGLPAGLWAALITFATVLGMFLHGRRLEAQIARLKVTAEAAKAQADRSQTEAHLQRAAELKHQVQRLERMRSVVRLQGLEEQRELSAMSPEALDKAYLKMAREKSFHGD